MIRVLAVRVTYFYYKSSLFLHENLDLTWSHTHTSAIFPVALRVKNDEFPSQKMAWRVGKYVKTFAVVSAFSHALKNCRFCTFCAVSLVSVFYLDVLHAVRFTHTQRQELLSVTVRLLPAFHKWPYFAEYISSWIWIFWSSFFTSPLQYYYFSFSVNLMALLFSQCNLLPLDTLVFFSPLFW
jgi:hypothetical protein